MATLFAASGAGAVVVALVSSIGFALTAEIGRVRDLELLWLLRRAGDELGHAILAWLPEIVHQPFHLTTARGYNEFVLAMLATSVGVTWLAALPLVPVVVVLYRWVLPPSGSRRRWWTWRVAFPLAVFAAAAIPAFYPLTLTLPIADRGAAKALGVALAVALWTAWVCVWRRPARAIPRLRALGLMTAVLAAVLAVPGAVLALRGADAPPRPLPPPDIPNVLLVSIDSLRADHLGCYGYARDTSPAIDALAADGARFETVISPTSWTLPAHMTMLTALPPVRHGVVRDRLRLGSDVVTLADVFQRAGFDTAGFVSGPYLDASYGFDRGFDHYDDWSLVKTMRTANYGETAPRLVDLIRRWLGRRAAREPARPFFVFLHIWDVHYNWMPPPPWDRHWDPDYRGPITGDPEIDRDVLHAGRPEDLQNLIARYDGEIRYTDEHLGTLIEHLRAMGELDRTVVVVTADHGTEFLEHGGIGHRRTLYDEVLRVPLVVRYPPRIPAGAVVDAQVRLMDVPRTLLGLARLRVPEGFGPGGEPPAAPIDLTPLIGATAPPRLPAFGDLHGELASVRTGDVKLIRDLVRGHAELFDLRADPDEHVNLAPVEAAAAARLGAEIDRWRHAAGTGAPPARSVELGDEQARRLRALGYIE